MNIPLQCDVVVIGGGPAGSIAATLLAQKGWSVVLLEKQLHPRYTVGESLIPHCWKYFDLIGVTEKILAAGFVRKNGGMVNWHGDLKAHTFKDFGYTSPAMHVERDRFDELLLRHAQEEGALVYEEVQVATTKADDLPAQVHYRNLRSNEKGSISCQYVIDASGQNAVVGRELGLRKFDESFRFMSIWGYFTGAKYLTIDGVAHKHEKIKEIPPVTYVTSLEGKGDKHWCWYIALRDNTSVGLVIPNSAVNKIKSTGETWEEYFIKQCQKTPVVNKLLADATFQPRKVHITRDYSYQSTQLAGQNYYLIGDAAGFVDPIFSVGVVLAIYTAYAAAWAVDASLKNPASSSMNRNLYEQQVRGRFEISRSLALPHYQPGQQLTKNAKNILSMEPKSTKQLMKTVSSLTDRSDNFNAITNGEQSIELSDVQLKHIKKLVI